MWYNEVNTAKYISHTSIPLSVSLGTKAKQSMVFMEYKLSTFQYPEDIELSIFLVHNVEDTYKIRSIIRELNCKFFKILSTSSVS